MIKKLRLENFKSFKNAELQLGGLTLIIGTNASGKSNLRDAFRFLHGISRGYTFYEIVNSKYGIGGELVWNGIRGGTREIEYKGKGDFSTDRVVFSMETHLEIEHHNEYGKVEFIYSIRIHSDKIKPIQIIEYLSMRSNYWKARALEFGDLEQLSDGWLSLPMPDRFSDIKSALIQPIFTQRVLKGTPPNEPYHTIIEELALMRFPEFQIDSMRSSSLPNHNILSDRGENLSAVLQNICADSKRKKIFIEWLQALTPMDAQDFEFYTDPFTGKILAILAEGNGQKTSIYSASEGTLRFLAMLAALSNPKEKERKTLDFGEEFVDEKDVNPFYFFEEIENGIHPSRLHLLIELLEKKAAEGYQIVATTHSPHLLNLISKETLENAHLTYRLEGQPDTRIKRILDIPNAKEILEKQDISLLHASGWFEDMTELLEN